MKSDHLSALDLECHHLGMVPEPELAAMEEHLLSCSSCVNRAAIAQQFADAMRAAIIAGDFDLDWLERNSEKKRA